MSPLLYPGSEQQKRDERRIAAQAALRSSERAPAETAGPAKVVAAVATGSKNEPRVLEDEELCAAASVAEEACREEQPMPSDGLNQALIADCCEIIAERHAKEKLWRSTSIALRMACWYYRKACAE